MALTIEAKRTSDGNKVALRYAYANKTRRYFSTGIVIPKSDFNKKSILKPVRSSNPNAAHLNRCAELVYSRIMDIESGLFKEGKERTAEAVYDLYQAIERKQRRGDQPSDVLSVAFERFMKSESYDAATAKLYRTLYTHLQRCFGDVSLKGLDLDDWIKFRDHLRITRKLSANSVHLRLSKFKHFIKFLKAEGLEIPISSFPMPKEEIKKVALDDISLQKIREMVPSSLSMHQVKDLCLVQCFTGLRISDLKRLNRSHIVRNEEHFMISMNALKTNKVMRIPLSDEALEILLKHNFNLPDLTEQYYNRQLKKLAREAGIDRKIEWLAYDERGKKCFKSANLSDLISSHACSRTAISYFIASYKPAVVCRILGKSMDTIMKYYYGLATEEEIDLAQRRAQCTVREMQAA